MSNEALASDPGGVTVDPRRLRQLSPSLFGAGAPLPTRAVVRKILGAHLWNGDSSSDFDAVVVLRFDRRPTDAPVCPLPSSSRADSRCPTWIRSG